jgi:hypothetical protein
LNYSDCLNDVKQRPQTAFFIAAENGSNYR